MANYLDSVKQDKLWSSHVENENKMRYYKWPGRWQFLIQEYHNMERELKGEPKHVYTPPQPISSGANVRDIIHFPPLFRNIEPKRNPFLSDSSSHEYGALCRFETQTGHLRRYLKFEPRARTFRDLCKVFKWPHGANV